MVETKFKNRIEKRKQHQLYVIFLRYLMFTKWKHKVSNLKIMHVEAKFLIFQDCQAPGNVD